MSKGIALRLFGELTAPYLGYFDTLGQNLKRTGVETTLHEYLCNILFYAMLMFIIFLIGSSVFITLIIPQMVYSYTLGIILSIVFSGLVFFMGYYYPSIVAKGLESKINKPLPFAVSYMATTAASGMKPVDIFKIASIRKGVLGKEAMKIYTNTRSLGMNLTDAMEKTAERSPSGQWADLLWGMSSVIKTGGNLEAYLKSRTRTFMSQYRRMLQEYARQVTFYTEIYITLVIVGSLFFIVLTAILSPIMGSGVLVLQTFIVFFFVPMVSIGFIVLMKGISPSE